MDTPPWLCRCELSVRAQPAGPARRAVPGIVHPPSLLLLGPKCLYTRQISQSFIRAEEEDRCLTPSPTDPMDRLCCIPGRSRKRSQACHQPLGWHGWDTVPLFAPSSITLIKQQSPQVPICICCGYKADWAVRSFSFPEICTEIPIPIQRSRSNCLGYFHFAVLRSKLTERHAESQQLQKGKEALNHSLSAERKRGCTVKSNFADPKGKCRIPRALFGKTKAKTNIYFCHIWHRGSCKETTWHLMLKYRVGHLSLFSLQMSSPHCWAPKG